MIGGVDVSERIVGARRYVCGTEMWEAAMVAEVRGSLEERALFQAGSSGIVEDDGTPARGRILVVSRRVKATRGMLELDQVIGCSLAVDGKPSEDGEVCLIEPHVFLVAFGRGMGLILGF